jgi:hypothetical protein
LPRALEHPAIVVEPQVAVLPEPEFVAMLSKKRESRGAGGDVDQLPMIPPPAIKTSTAAISNKKCSPGLAAYPRAPAKGEKGRAIFVASVVRTFDMAALPVKTLRWPIR